MTTLSVLLLTVLLVIVTLGMVSIVKELFDDLFHHKQVSAAYLLKQAFFLVVGVVLLTEKGQKLWSLVF